MTKKGKTKRPAIKHWRSVKDGTYIEERGLRRIELHTEKPLGKKSIFNSEDPLDKARVLNKAAERIFEEANEKTLDQVIGEAAATTGAGTDPLMLDAKAIDNWLAGIMQPPRCALADIGGGPVFNSETQHHFPPSRERAGGSARCN